MKTYDTWGRRERLTALAITAAVVALLALLVLAGTADAAPLAGQPVQFRAKLFAVHCWAGFCNAGVTLRYEGVPRVGTLIGRNLYEGQYVTINATVNSRSWRLSDVRRVWR